MRIEVAPSACAGAAPGATVQEHRWYPLWRAHRFPVDGLPVPNWELTTTVGLNRWIPLSHIEIIAGLMRSLMPRLDTGAGER
jgi:hypothetical protein